MASTMDIEPFTPADAARRARLEMPMLYAWLKPDEAVQARAMYSHGAVFAEVKVDPDLGQVRCTRLVGAFAAGRIINPRLVRSQY